MRTSISILIICICGSMNVFAQSSNSELPISINSSGLSPAEDAILDVQSDDKGILIPRMTTIQRTNINGGAPTEGLMVFDTDKQSFWYYDGNEWKDLASGLWSVGSFGIESDSTQIGINTAAESNIRINVDSGSDFSGPNKSTINVVRQGTSTDPVGGGTSWNNGFVDAGIKSFSLWGNRYSAAIMGYTWHDYGESAGVGGADQNGNNAGYLSYQADNGAGGGGTIYSGYFTDDVKIDGDLTLEDLSGTSTRNLKVDQNGKLIADPSINYRSFSQTDYFLTTACMSTNESAWAYGSFTCTGEAYLPIHLPHGSTLIEITINYIDNSDNNFIASLLRREKTTSILYSVDFLGTFPNATGLDSYVIPVNENIDIENNVYLINIKPEFQDTWDGLNWQVGSVYVSYIE